MRGSRVSCAGGEPGGNFGLGRAMLGSVSGREKERSMQQQQQPLQGWWRMFLRLDGLRRFAKESRRAKHFASH